MMFDNALNDKYSTIQEIKELINEIENDESGEDEKGYNDFVEAGKDYIKDLETEMKDLHKIKIGTADKDTIEKYNGSKAFKTYADFSPTHIDYATGIDRGNGFVKVQQIEEDKYLVTTADGNSVVKPKSIVEKRYHLIKDNEIAQELLEKNL